MKLDPVKKHAQPPFPPPLGSCHFFVNRKGRYCNMQVVKDNYCGEHSSSRVKCPIDPSHTVDRDRLEFHLSRCCSKKTVSEYYSEDINGKSEVNLRVLRNADIQALKEKIEAVYEHVDIREDYTMHQQILECKKQKHYVQICSLINKTPKGRNMVEFGCGRGEMSYYMSQIHDTANYYLVDRSNQRYKFKVGERVMIDIKDLDMAKLVNDEYVVYSKHLCGAATDLAINSIVPSLLKGMCIALCCHHRCDYGQYCNKKYLEECGISREEFEFMCLMSAWATCGRRENESGDFHYSGLKYEEREALGLKCKAILNRGRVKRLEEIGGYKVELVKYCPREISLEDVCLLVNKHYSK